MDELLAHADLAIYAGKACGKRAVRRHGDAPAGDRTGDAPFTASLGRSARAGMLRG